MSIEILELDHDDPGARGEAHGEHWRGPIRELAELRAELALQKGQVRTRVQLDAIAGLHLPALAAFSPALSAELHGIARAAGITPEAAVILNHYTDLRDVPASVLDAPGPAGHVPPATSGEDPGGCTAIYVPAPGGPLLGQTWDMHASAEPYVRVLRLRPRGGEGELLLFTLTGCLGMAGLAGSGLGVTINNLSSTDGQVGLVWPALVRGMLAAGSAAAARDLLLAARLSSGHHYMLADGREFFGIETSGALKVVTQNGARAAHLHTNHCFDPVLRKREAVPRASTSFRRMELATTLYVQQRPQTARGLWDLLSSHEGHPRSICSHVGGEGEGPSASRTCGLLVMNLSAGRVLVGRGCGQASAPTELSLTRWHLSRAPAST